MKKIFIPFLLVVMSISAFAQNYKDGAPIDGYASYMSQVAKRQHEVGVVGGFSSLNQEALGTAFHFMLGATYQYNINPYVGWYTELSFSYDPINLKNPITVGPINIPIPGQPPQVIGPFEIKSLQQFSASLLTGARAYPWQNWFYLGGGIGVRYFQLFTPSQIPKEYKDKFSEGLKDSLKGGNQQQVALQYYAEAGLHFPTKYLDIEIGYRYRGNVLGNLPSLVDMPFLSNVKTDMSSEINLGELTIGLRVPLGKTAKSNEEKWKAPFNDLEADDVQVKVTDVYFAPNSIFLDGRSRGNIDKLLPLIYQMNPRQIIVRGHALNVENQGEEFEIAGERARAVRGYLESLGLRGIQAETVGSAERWADKADEKQRRVEIILVR